MGADGEYNQTMQALHDTCSSEDIAGGLSIAHLAYRRWASENGENLKRASLPGLKYSNEQLFFIQYGALWCDYSTYDDLQRVVGQPQCTNRMNGFGAIQNSKA